MDIDRYIERLEKKKVRVFMPPRFTVMGDDDDEMLRFSHLIARLANLPPQTWYVKGPAGSGKTTLTFHLAVELLKQDVLCFRVHPLFLRSRLFRDVSEMIRSGKPAEVDEALWKSKVKHGKIVIIVDGVNEIEREFGQSDIWPMLMGLISGGHAFPVLATSRRGLPGMQDSEQREIFSCRLLPPTHDTVDDYLTSRNLDSGRFFAEVRATGMEDAASNPFLLSLLADFLSASESGAQLKSAPKSRAELLKFTISQAIDKNRLSGQEMEITDDTGLGLDAIACAASLTLLASGKRDGSVRHLESLVSKVWKPESKMKAMTKAFLDTQMVVHLAENREFRWAHDSFFDFALALAWSDRPLPSFSMDPKVVEHFVADWVGLHAEGIEKAVEAAVNLAKEYSRYDLLPDIVFANKGLLDTGLQKMLWEETGIGLVSGRHTRDLTADALADIPARTVREAIRLGLFNAVKEKFPNFSGALETALIRGELNSERLQRLGQIYRREFSHVRNTGKRGKKEISKKVKHAKDLSIVENYAEALKSHPEPSKRREAANRIGNSFASEACPVLTESLLSDPDHSVRGASATALGKIGDTNAVEPLSSAVSNPNESSDVRGSAASALGSIGDKRAVEALANALTSRQ